MENPYHSKRLIYRAVETPEDDAFFLAMQSDPFAYTNMNIDINQPQGKKSAAAYQKFVAEQTYLGVVFCLPPTSEGTVDKPAKPIPVGAIHLDGMQRKQAHHRNAEIGICILPQYQGQGYGSEAIRWVLRWAFETAALHRVDIKVFGYNTGAKKLYERLGFKLEGTRREYVWHGGRWWDDHLLGMLDREWHELQEK